MFQRIITIVIVVVIVIGGGFYTYQQLMPEVEETNTGPTYSTQAVERGDISVGVDTVGQLNPSDSGGINVSNALRMLGYSGELIIDEILAEEGDNVNKEQLLVRLSAPGLQDDIDDLREQIKTEEEALSRLTNLPRAEVRNINPSQGVTIRAEISGRIQDLDIVEGDEISQGETIAKIVDTSKYKIPLKLRPSEFNTINKGDKVSINFRDFDGLYEGVITEVNSNPVPSGEVVRENENKWKAQGYEYRVTVEGENLGLVQPGMQVRVGPNSETGHINLFMNSSIVEGYVEEERISSTTEGLVTEVHVKGMDEVEEGDPIISLAGSDVQETIEKRLDKIRNLESKIRELESIFPMLEITSPMEGIVASINRQEGDTTSSGDWLGHVYNTANMMMFTEVDDIDVLYVKQGSEVNVTVDAIPGETYEGEVMQVSTRGSGQDGIARFSVYIDVVGGPQLRPGMQANGYIDAGSAEDVLLVPIEAIFQEENRHKVEILDANGEPQIIDIEIGLMNDRYAEVISGLEEGDLVVTGSSRDLLPSQDGGSNNNFMPDMSTEESEK